MCTTHLPLLRFAAIEIDSQSGELRRAGFRIHVAQQARQVLMTLLEEPGRIYTRQELKEVLCPENRYGDFDHTLNKCIHELRHALHDNARNPAFIETFSGRGYRFIGVATEQGTAPEQSGALEWAAKPLRILPFVVTQEDAEARFWSEQVVCEVTDQLSRSGAVKVLAHEDVSGSPASSGSSTVGCGCVVGGTVLRQCSCVYVHAEMIDTVGGVQIWGKSWTIAADELLQSKSAVVSDIVSRVRAATRRALRRPGVKRGSAEGSVDGALPEKRTNGGNHVLAFQTGRTRQVA